MTKSPAVHTSYYVCSTLLRIRAVPKSVVFCSNSVRISTPIFEIQFCIFFVTTPRTPTIIGITSTLFVSQIRIISNFSGWSLSTFSSSFFATLSSPGTAMSIKRQCFLSLSTSIRSGLLAMIFSSYWILKSQRSFTFALSLLLLLCYFTQADVVLIYTYTEGAGNNKLPKVP